MTMLTPPTIDSVEALQSHGTPEPDPLLPPAPPGADHKLILHRACDKLIRLSMFYKRVSAYCEKEAAKATDPLRIAQLTERRQMSDRFQDDITFITNRCMQFLPPEEKRAINNLVYKNERHFDGLPPGNLR